MARSDDADSRAARWEKEAHDLSTQVAFIQEELALLRRKLTESPRHVRQLEERLAAAQAQLTRLAMASTRSPWVAGPEGRERTAEEDGHERP